MDFPLIYVNGCSYSDENYRAELQKNTYAYHYARLVDGFVVSRARSGSCNRRIIRTTVHDLISQRQLNPTQKIIAFIQLTFEIRDELWLDEIENTLDPCESQFRTHQFSGDLNWRENLLKGIFNLHTQPSVHTKFLKKWSEGRAFYYSPYAERINLLTDLVLLKFLMQQLEVDYLIFQGPSAEPLTPDYLKDFFLAQLDDTNILNLETFSFCDWCNGQGFTSFEDIELSDSVHYHNGHYRADAHQAFAEKFLAERKK